MAKSKQDQKKPTSQGYWSLVWWKFKKNKLAIVGGIILLLMYFTMVIIPEFISPYLLERSSEYTAAKPQAIRFVDSEGKWQAPFVYGLERKVDTKTRTRYYVENTAVKYPVRLFVKGDSLQTAWVHPDGTSTCSVRPRPTRRPRCSSWAPIRWAATTSRASSMAAGSRC